MCLIIQSYAYICAYPHPMIGVFCDAPYVIVRQGMIAVILSEPNTSSNFLHRMTWERQPYHSPRSPDPQSVSRIPEKALYVIAPWEMSKVEQRCKRTNTMIVHDGQSKVCSQYNVMVFIHERRPDNIIAYRWRYTRVVHVVSNRILIICIQSIVWRDQQSFLIFFEMFDHDIIELCWGHMMAIRVVNKQSMERA